MTRVVNTVIFIFVFIFIFAVLQQVFIPKDTDLQAIAQFYNEPADSLDVLITGSSGAMLSVFPAVLWDVAGITSYNLSLASMNRAGAYYVLKEALRFQSPRVVIVEADTMFYGMDYDESRTEVSFREALDAMRWSSVKLSAVNDILANSERQSFADYLFPLLRYHDRQDITPADFDFSYKKQRNPAMGSWWIRETSYREVERPAIPAQADATPEIFDEYHVKIIEMCRNKGIEVILISTPTCDEICLTTAWHQALNDFADEHGVAILNYNIPDLYNTVNIDASRDFCDRTHTNISGAVKVSTHLAHYLQENYNLSDRRDSAYDSHWDGVVSRHIERYAQLLSTFPENG